VLIVQKLDAPLSELFRPACDPQCASGGAEVGDAERTEVQ
jgi:hypothetical protein